MSPGLYLPQTDPELILCVPACGSTWIIIFFIYQQWLSTLGHTPSDCSLHRTCSQLRNGMMSDDWQIFTLIFR